MSYEIITNKKKVAIICRAWYPNHEQIFSELIKSNSDSFEIFYIVTAGVESSKYNMRPWQMPQTSFNRIITPSKTITIFDKDIIIPIGIISTLRKIKPDLIVVTPWSEISTFIGILYGKFFKINTLSWLPGPFDTARSRKERFRNFFTRVQMSACVHLSTSVLIYGPSVEAAIKKLIFFRSLLGKNINFYNVFHGVHEATYEAPSKMMRNKRSCIGRKIFNIPEDVYVIGYVGQLLERKGIAQLVSALNEVLINNAVVYFFVLGSGPLGYLVENIKTKFGERVVMLNKCESADLKIIYATIDLMVIPSLRDDWCTITNECFLSRTLVMGSIYAYSTRDLITNKVTGYTFDPLCHNEFVSIIEDLISNNMHNSRIVDNAYNFIKKSWSEADSLKSWTIYIKKFINYE